MPNLDTHQGFIRVKYCSLSCMWDSDCRCEWNRYWQWHRADKRGL